MKLLALLTWDRFDSNDLAVGIYLRVVTLAVAIAATAELCRSAAIDFAMSPFREDIARLVRLRMQNELSVLNSYMHRLSLVASAAWNGSNSLNIGQSARGLVDTIDHPPLSLAFRNLRLLHKGGISVLFPSVVVHSAPATAKAKFVATIDGTRQAGFIASRALGALFSRRTFDRGITKSAKAVIVMVAKTERANRLKAFLKSTLFHGLNIPLQASTVNQLTYLPIMDGGGSN